MRIDRINIELEPWVMADGNIVIRIELTVNGNKVQIRENYYQDDFESMFHTYWQLLEEKIRRAMQEEKKDEHR